MVILVVALVMSAVGVGATVRALASDGMRRVPTRHAAE